MTRATVERMDGHGYIREAKIAAVQVVEEATPLQILQAVLCNYNISPNDCRRTGANESVNATERYSWFVVDSDVYRVTTFH